MPSRVLSALRFGLGTTPNTMVDSPGGDGLTPLSLAAIYGECGMDRLVRVDHDGASFFYIYSSARPPAPPPPRCPPPFVSTLLLWS